tara:strand:+ start:3565 stop:4176 length:612 start_codon:yes stop_codon:yes gene_type:complete
MKKRKQHWETVFNNKSPEEVSWTEKYPKTSMDLISTFKLDKSASIIDVGGGDSLLVDALLEEGYHDITLLDISEKAISKAQSRLGARAKGVTWIVSDIINFIPKKKYVLWHDRASFHFLTHKKEIQKYNQLVSNSVSHFMVIGAFSNSGPKKCSGLTITQYSCLNLSKNFEKDFKGLECIKFEHITPFNTKQDFVFSRFEKIS